MLRGGAAILNLADYSLIASLRLLPVLEVN